MAQKGAQRSHRERRRPQATPTRRERNKSVRLSRGWGPWSLRAQGAGRKRGNLGRLHALTTPRAPHACSTNHPPSVSPQHTEPFALRSVRRSGEAGPRRRRRPWVALPTGRPAPRSRGPLPSPSLRRRDRGASHHEHHTVSFALCARARRATHLRSTAQRQHWLRRLPSYTQGF